MLCPEIHNIVMNVLQIFLKNSILDFLERGGGEGGSPIIGQPGHSADILFCTVRLYCLKYSLANFYQVEPIEVYYIYIL